MFRKQNVRKSKLLRRSAVQRFTAREEDHAASDDFMAAGNIPAWRSLLRFLVLGLMAVGAIYLSAASMNILILGTDDVDYSKRTDTIMMIHWRPLPRRLSVLSIPRDTYIQMPKKGPMKINAVYAYGNALGSRDYALALTRASIETLLGVKIHYVIHVCYSDFIKLVDTLGGVSIQVEKRMRYTDQAGGLNINLDPGLQVLDGRQALDYVRFRHDEDGDIGRIRRQQKFTHAFVGQMLDVSKAPDTLSAFYTFIKQVETNLTLPTAFFLAMEIKGVARGSWKQVILPGEPVFIEGKAYWKPNLQAIRQVLAELGKAPEKAKNIKSSLDSELAGADSEADVISEESSPEPLNSEQRSSGAKTTTQAIGQPEESIAADTKSRVLNKPAVEILATPVVRPTPRKIVQPLVQPKNKAVQVAVKLTPKPTPKRTLAALPTGQQPTIRVLNGCGVPGVASRITQRMMNNNVQIRAQDCTNAPSFTFPKTIIKSKAKNLPWARRIATILNLGEERIQTIPENINYPTVTIVIGGDYQELIR